MIKMLVRILFVVTLIVLILGILYSKIFVVITCLFCAVLQAVAMNDPML
jgi:hypothetical protein